MPHTILLNKERTICTCIPALGLSYAETTRMRFASLQRSVQNHSTSFRNQNKTTLKATRNMHIRNADVALSPCAQTIVAFPLKLPFVALLRPQKQIKQRITAACLLMICTTRSRCDKEPNISSEQRTPYQLFRSHSHVQEIQSLYRCCNINDGKPTG